MKLKYGKQLLASLLLALLASLVHAQDDSMDPVARQLMASMEAPTQLQSADSNSSVLNLDIFTANKAARSIAGEWHLELENGAAFNLALSQSKSVIFGSGNVTSSAQTQVATASGSISGDILKLYIVPADGTKLYVLSLDLSGQTPAKTYSIFSANAETLSGTVRKVSYSILE